ncbi:hypothetical protein EON67_03510 [archaeon]|nr:MAG: hypothetical protein EON67_03510 [archaeon]
MPTTSLQRDAVAIIGFNSPQWMISNVGGILADGIAAGIYTTNSAPACAYIVNHAHATIVVCEGEKQLQKFMSIRTEMPSVKAYVVWGATVPSVTNHTKSALSATLADAAAHGVYSWDQFMSLGMDESRKSELQREVERRMAGQLPEDVCSLVYTSGTMSMPKAVMISHDNLMFIATSVLTRFEATEGERLVSYLPVRVGATQPQRRAHDRLPCTHHRVRHASTPTPRLCICS